MLSSPAHRERWRLVNNFISDQIRDTPAEIKVQQMNAMFSLGQSRSHVSLAEEQEVRNRWRLLKQKADVCASSVNPPD